MKRVTVLWFSLVILLSIFLFIIGLRISKNNKEYKELENNIVEAAKIYFGQDTNLKKLPEKGSTYKITIDDLNDFGLNVKTTLSNDSCKGYLIVKAKNIAFEYKPYIHCNAYETNGYKE